MSVCERWSTSKVKGTPAIHVGTTLKSNESASSSCRGISREEVVEKSATGNKRCDLHWNLVSDMHLNTRNRLFESIEEAVHLQMAECRCFTREQLQLELDISRRKGATVMWNTCDTSRRRREVDQTGNCW
jgi:hypothetical protein